MCHLLRMTESRLIFKDKRIAETLGTRKSNAYLECASLSRAPSPPCIVTLLNPFKRIQNPYQRVSCLSAKYEGYTC